MANGFPTAGFEPRGEDSTGFEIRRLNHSVTPLFLWGTSSSVSSCAVLLSAMQASLLLTYHQLKAMYLEGHLQCKDSVHLFLSS